MKPNAIEPILLTEFGDLLQPRNDRGEDDAFDSFSGDSFGIYIGCHQHDEPSHFESVIYFRPISKTYFVLWCSRCGRICDPIPREVNTYAKLRQWCAGVIASEQHHAEKVRQLISDHAAYGPCLDDGKLTDKEVAKLVAGDRK